MIQSGVCATTAASANSSTRLRPVMVAVQTSQGPRAAGAEFKKISSTPLGTTWTRSWARRKDNSSNAPPGGVGDAGVREAIGIPGHPHGERGGRNLRRTVVSHFCNASSLRERRAGRGQQFRHDDLAPLAVGEGDVICGRPAGEMDDVATLRVIPPADVIRFNAGLLQSGLGLEELLLEAAMGQGKRQVMVEQDFSFFSGA